jgi:hypothetical protein
MVLYGKHGMHKLITFFLDCYILQIAAFSKICQSYQASLSGLNVRKGKKIDGDVWRDTRRATLFVYLGFTYIGDFTLILGHWVFPAKVAQLVAPKGMWNKPNWNIICNGSLLLYNKVSSMISERRWNTVCTSYLNFPMMAIFCKLQFFQKYINLTSLPFHAKMSKRVSK